MIGGSGEKVTLKIAAQYASISHLVAARTQTTPFTLNDLDHKLSVLKKHCENVGRDYREIRTATPMRLENLEDPSNIEKTVENIEQYRNKGIGLLTFVIPNPTYIEILSKKIIPRF